MAWWKKQPPQSVEEADQQLLKAMQGRGLDHDLLLALVVLPRELMAALNAEDAQTARATLAAWKKSAEKFDLFFKKIPGSWSEWELGVLIDRTCLMPWGRDFLREEGFEIEIAQGDADSYRYTSHLFQDLTLAFRAKDQEVAERLVRDFKEYGRRVPRMSENGYGLCHWLDWRRANAWGILLLLKNGMYLPSYALDKLFPVLFRAPVGDAEMVLEILALIQERSGMPLSEAKGLKAVLKEWREPIGDACKEQLGLVWESGGWGIKHS